MKLGTIGTSWITESFIDAVKSTNQLTLTSVYSRSMEAAEQFAKKHNAESAFDDLEKMARSSEIEVVYIASPNSHHYEQAKIFIQNKKHVICEKPIFSNLKEWEEIYRLAEEHGVFVFEAIRNFHSPNFTILKKNLEKAGVIRSAMLHYLQYSSRYDAFLRGENPNVFSPDFSGGALTDLGVYAIYAAVGLFGAPKSVSYHPVLLRNGIDGSGTLVLEYDSFVCTVLFSKIAASYISSEIHGEKGAFLLDKVSPISSVEFIDHKTHEKESLGVEQAENDMVYEIDQIVRTVETNDRETYESWKEASRIVLSITEEARRQNNIVFGTEK
ncbi:putative dehydrogenase [Peribacillus deserti]|uniref:Dehydrogenase n=1 Tax=Peribacillus deserti TaxID=673318 RepID=A0ABS2QJW6_9BACI|nr:Gfo/Idh/MocA family oxidoreductase [Peribacillus deserti]MBM7693466.1 putative dehydrogenase [Peribacillus deserti]